MTLISVLFCASCAIAPPENVNVVKDFDSQRYLGDWYEIARLDSWFEKGLTQVSANYTLRDDNGINGIKVTNRGFNPEKQQWQESIGKAYFTQTSDIASLKVSFFGPFYGGYNVIALAPDYSYALVCGSNRDYLWILSRTTTLDSKIINQLVTTAKQYGFDTDKLVWVKQQIDTDKK